MPETNLEQGIWIAAIVWLRWEIEHKLSPQATPRHSQSKEGIGGGGKEGV